MSLHRLELLDEMGLSPQWRLRDSTSVRRGEAKIKASAQDNARETPAIEVASVEPLAHPSLTVSPPDADRAQQIAQMGWDELNQSIAACRACALCTQRKQAVPGVGDQKADWLFIGEGPGAEEDERGEPFVGQAGKLLDAMLSAIDLKRGENVYIGNAVKCRPPGNRTPEALEVATCLPYLKRQIELLQPRLIVLLGKAAVHAVLGVDSALASLRGKPSTFVSGEQSVPVVVTYHPAYLLRTLPDKSKAWEDLCRARALMGTLKAD